MNAVLVLLALLELTGRVDTRRVGSGPPQVVFAESDHAPPPPPPPPAPEPIKVTELPLPPVLGNTSTGSCSLDIQPRGTGCIAQSGLNSGSFLPDGKHVLATATFVGATGNLSDPASVYNGTHLIILKADGTTFVNGDTWKCVTCGIPAPNRESYTGDINTYPQAFRDGRRAMAGSNVIDCGPYLLQSDACTPAVARIYGIRLSDRADDDGSGPGLAIRELRIHPDNVHIGFSAFASTTTTTTEYAYFGRLHFNATGQRYDVVNATILYNPHNPPVITASEDGSRQTLHINSSAITVGELRGFTGAGDEVIYVGYPVESCNIDIFAVGLSTGRVRRITEHPEYVDPVAVSADNKWQVILDTRGTNRQMFLAGLRTVPPVSDLITVTASSSTRNNRNRRFFQPWLLDIYGDRGLYFGQKINAEGDGTPGSINDPYWNAGADPRWSLDGTRIVYYQMLAVPPACGGDNPLPCELNSYADGRQERVMIADLTSREPYSPPIVNEVSDEVQWGLPYVPGMTFPTPTLLAAGKYTLEGLVSGHANVTITHDSTSSYIQSIAVKYTNFSNDGDNVLSGWENVTANPETATQTVYDWYSNLTSVGTANGTKITSEDGFHLSMDFLVNDFQANGTLTTTIDNISFHQPCNGC